MIHSIDGVGSEAARPIKAGMLGSGATPSAAATNVTTGQATNDQAQDLTSLCASIYERVVAFLSISANDHFVLETQQQTSKALLVLEDALDQYRYAPDRLAKPDLTYVVSISCPSATMAAKTALSS